MCGLWLTTPMNAQFLNRLIDSAKKSAEDAIEQQVNKKVEEGIDKAFNPEVPEKDQQEQQQQEEAEPQQQAAQRQPQAQAPTPAPTKTLESAYAKSDFVPGDEYISVPTFAPERLQQSLQRQYPVLITSL